MKVTRIISFQVDSYFVFKHNVVGNTRWIPIKSWCFVVLARSFCVRTWVEFDGKPTKKNIYWLSELWPGRYLSFNKRVIFNYNLRRLIILILSLLISINIDVLQPKVLLRRLTKTSLFADDSSMARARITLWFILFFFFFFHMLNANYFRKILET